MAACNHYSREKPANFILEVDFSDSSERINWDDRVWKGKETRYESVSD